MKDEKMAEEYAVENWEHYEEGQTDYKALKQAFLAGLKAGRPQWHDLRKNPADLPKEYCIVYYKDSFGEPSLSVVHPSWYIAGVKAFFKNNPQIIAWKEIVLPVLPKESE